MLESIITWIFVVYIVRMILKHNLFISNIKLKAKFLGLDLEIQSKEKKHPSNQ